MTNPYIDKIIKNPEKNNKKKGFPLGDWIIIISTIFCASLIAFIVILPKIVWSVTGPPEISPCAKVETDAQSTLVALVSYFSETDKNEMPTVQDLMKSEDLTIDKNSTVIIDGPKDSIRVTVIENKNRCGKGIIFEVNMGGAAGEWHRK